MLKYLKSIDWCALSTSTLFLIVVSWLVPFAPKEPPTEHVISAQQQGSNSNAGRISQVSVWVHDNRDDIAAVSTFFIAAFTFTLFGANVALWKASRRTIEETARIAEEEFIASHPPRIRIKHVSLESDIWHGEKIIVRTVIVNTGKTVAAIWQGNIQTLVIPASHALPNESVLREKFVHYPATPHFILQSGITLVYPDQTDNRILSPEDHAAIRKGEKRLYVIGTIDYLDRASRIKKTAYCRYLALRLDANVNDRGRLCVHDDSDYEYED
jgi:hypothetical protein